jgi:hypothetical protein
VLLSAVKFNSEKGIQRQGKKTEGLYTTVQLLQSMAHYHLVKLEKIPSQEIDFGLLWTGEQKNRLQVVLPTAKEIGEFYGDWVVNNHGCYEPGKKSLSFEKPCDRVPGYLGTYLYKVLPLEQSDIEKFDEGTLEKIVKKVE